MRQYFCFFLLACTFLIGISPASAAFAENTPLASVASPLEKIILAPLPYGNLLPPPETPSYFSNTNFSTVGVLLILASFCLFALHSMRKKLAKTTLLAQTAMLAAQQASPTETASPVAEYLVQLCHKNQLLRLSAIQRIGDFGLTQGNHQRAISLLAAYVRAITNDSELRAMAKAEIYEALTMISAIITASKQPMSVYLSKINLSGLFLRHLDLRFADLSESDFSNSTLESVQFDGAFLDGSSFASATLENTSFIKSSFVGVNWTAARLHNVAGVTEDDIANSVDTAFATKKAALAGFGRVQSMFAETTHMAIDKSKLH